MEDTDMKDGSIRAVVMAKSNSIHLPLCLQSKEDKPSGIILLKLL